MRLSSVTILSLVPGQVYMVTDTLASSILLPISDPSSPQVDSLALPVSPELSAFSSSASCTEKFIETLTMTSNKLHKQLSKKATLTKHSKCIYPRSTRNVSRHTRTFRLRTPAELKFTYLHLCYWYRLQQNILHCNK